MRREDITPESKIAELRLDISHPNSREKVFILLEGDSDVKLFRKFFDTDICKIETIPGGKFFLEAGLETLNSITSKIIGIRDADFLHLERVPPRFPNLFFTDYHDYELMMISIRDCQNAILSEHTSININEHEQVFERLLLSLKFLGYLRWYNDKENLEFNFNGLGLSELFNNSDISMQEIDLVESILRRSPNARNKNIQQIINGVNRLYDDSHDLLQVCNGHDFMKVLAFFCSTRSSQINDKVIVSQCRISYSLEHFKQTQLFRDTSNWALQNKCVIYR